MILYVQCDWLHSLTIRTRLGLYVWVKKNIFDCLGSYTLQITKKLKFRQDIILMCWVILPFKEKFKLTLILFFILTQKNELSEAISFAPLKISSTRIKGQVLL
jgi:hypothetical protein